MDAAVILIIALVYACRYLVPKDSTSIEVQEVSEATEVCESGATVADSQTVVRQAKTNDDYYKDENAFTSISKALGF